MPTGNCSFSPSILSSTVILAEAEDEDYQDKDLVFIKKRMEIKRECCNKGESERGN